MSETFAEHDMTGPEPRDIYGGIFCAQRLAYFGGAKIKPCKTWHPHNSVFANATMLEAARLLYGAIDAVNATAQPRHAANIGEVLMPVQYIILHRWEQLSSYAASEALQWPLPSDKCGVFNAFAESCSRADVASFKESQLTRYGGQGVLDGRYATVDVSVADFGSGLLCDAAPPSVPAATPAPTTSPSPPLLPAPPSPELYCPPTAMPTAAPTATPTSSPTAAPTAAIPASATTTSSPTAVGGSTDSSIADSVASTNASSVPTMNGSSSTAATTTASPPTVTPSTAAAATATVVAVCLSFAALLIGVIFCVCKKGAVATTTTMTTTTTATTTNAAFNRGALSSELDTATHGAADAAIDADNEYSAAVSELQDGSDDDSFAC